MDLTRKQVIEILEQFCNSLDMLSENKLMQALDYAISSLKTDEAYQIIYEGGEIFTVDEVIDTLINLKEEITNIYESSGIQVFNSERVNFYFNVLSKFDKTINSLRGN